jgi:hypothetical protein
MQPYLPPVAGLLELGYPHEQPRWHDYASFGIGPAHVPELIRLMRDKDILESIPDDEEDDPRWYGYIHAWRALGHLRAPEAIEPLVELLAAQTDDDEWSDWVNEEVPRVLGMIGPAALPVVAARLESRGKGRWPTVGYGNALLEIGKQHPEARAETVQLITRVLEAATDNDDALNGFLIGDLIDLDAKESWPIIENAFATGSVDETIVGDEADVKWRLGLGPEPPRRHGPYRTAASSEPPRTNAKQRFNERQRKKKLEKKKRKKK